MTWKASAADTWPRRRSKLHKRLDSEKCSDYEAAKPVAEINRRRTVQAAFIEAIRAWRFDIEGPLSCVRCHARA